MRLISMISIISITLSLNGQARSGDDVFPAPLLLTDDLFTHHVIVAEKTTHKVHIFENSDGHPRLVKTYNAVTGKRTGDKRAEGDLKTPEGMYELIKFLPQQEIISMYGNEQAKIYGSGAFVTDYPNEIDRRAGKTGDGIWLHSTDDPSRIFRGLDSRGCVVVNDEDLKEISQFIEVNMTPIVIVQDLNYLSSEGWKAKRTKLEEAVEGWRKSWEEEDLQSYLGHYDQNIFSDPSKGKTFKLFADYKKAVFSGPGKPQVRVRNLSLIEHNGYAFAIFVQGYKSATIDDEGKKVLVFKLDENYNWKIMVERFQKDFSGRNVAFTPSNRYFRP